MFQRSTAVYHCRGSICDIISLDVRSSERGFPGLIKSSKVNDQQTVWMTRRTAIKRRKDESFTIVD
jgi:hypothetical protein